MSKSKQKVTVDFSTRRTGTNSLQETELIFLAQSLPHLVWATEADGYAFFFNERWLKYTGLSFEDIKGDGWTKSLHPDDFELTFKTWQHSVKTGEAYNSEYRLRGADGEYRWFKAMGTPMRDDDNKILQWYGTSTDIHNEKIIQENLVQTRERFDLLSKATQDAIWDWNLLNNEVWWNEGFKEMFGYSDADISGDVSSWYDRLHPDDRELVVTTIHNVIDNGGKLWSAEYRFLRKDGSYALVYDRGYALHDKANKPYRMLGSMQDITKRKEAEKATKLSEQRFQAAVEAMDGVLWTNSPDGMMTGRQPGWEELTGQSFEEYQGSGWAKAIHPEDAAATIKAWNEAVKKQKSFVFEHRLKTSHGNYRIFAVRAIPVKDPAGEISEWVGVHTDVTEQRKAEEFTKQSEQRFQNLVREASVGIIVLMGEECKVAVVNDSYAKMIGRTVNDLLNEDLFDIIPEAREPFKPIIDKVRNSGEPVYLYDQPYTVYSGPTQINGFLNIVYQPYREKSGEITGVMVLCQDVSAQINSRKKTEEAQETARLAVISAGLGTFDVDLITNKVIASDRLNQIFDVENDSERDRLISAIHPQDLDIREEAYKEAVKTGYLEYEVRIIKKDNSIRWIRVKGRYYSDNGQKPTKLVGVVNDITEEKEFAQELSRQVAERTAELEQFSFVSHHDLQEPLRKIIMFAGLIKSESLEILPAQSQQRLNKVIEAARRMSTALREVLNFASLNMQETLEQVDLKKVMLSVMSDLEVAIEERSARIEYSDLPVIKGFPRQINQLFYNLLNNALKFSKANEQNEIRIQTQKISDAELARHPELKQDKIYYHIIFSDTGIGFKQGYADKIFVLFQRLHTRERYEGTGIGLALCKKVVSNHEGKIWAESEEGRGATFHILLPE